VAGTEPSVFARLEDDEGHGVTLTDPQGFLQAVVRQRVQFKPLGRNAPTPSRGYRPDSDRRDGGVPLAAQHFELHPPPTFIRPVTIPRNAETIVSLFR
jgi:hypothetical protein